MLFLQIVSDTADIMDIDTLEAESLRITVLDLYPGDEYVFPSQPSLSMDQQINGSSQITTYSGTADVGVYVNLLRSFQFSNNLDEPQTGTRSLTIQVFTPGDVPGLPLGSNRAQVSIEVVAVNDNSPMFSQAEYNGSVVENAPAGTTTGIVIVATDADVFGATNITYEIAGGNPYFFISAIDGIITTLLPLDAEMTSSHEFSVIAHDNDSPSLSSSVEVRITVQDLNDNPPIFDRGSYVSSVPENSPPNSNVLQVFANDTDISPSNSEITYQIEMDSQESGIGSGGPITPLTDNQDSIPFEINPTTGVISTITSLDFETAPLYSFTVVAMDSGSLASSANVTIDVTDINDNRPRFVVDGIIVDSPLYQVELRENTTVSSTILTISASDADSNTELQFSVNGSTFFQIDQTSGALFLAQSLDYDQETSHNFTVVVSDNGVPPLSSVAELVVSVTNVNDNPPVFVQDSYTFNVIENMQLSEQLVASDPDGDQVEYFISPGTGFVVDSFTGQLTSATELDFETQNEYSLVVGARDGVFESTVNVVITVLDANDLRPVFTEQSYSVAIRENTPMGTSFLQVEAQDGDTGSNADVVYSIESGNDNGTFSIDSSGNISVVRPLDFDLRTQPTAYLLTVAARNTEPPYFNSTATVSVTLIDENDLMPMLFLDQLNITFIENSDPLPIAAGIVVTDLDSDDHLILGCMVRLTRPDVQCDSAVCDEEITVNEALASQLGITVNSNFSGTEQVILMNGVLEEISYQSVLSTIMYINSVGEPEPGLRSVQIQCRDANFMSNNIPIMIDVELINEYCPEVRASTAVFTYVEESDVFQVGEAAQFIIDDLDRPPHDTLLGVTISLLDVADVGFEFISIIDDQGLQVVTSEGTEGSAALLDDSEIELRITGQASSEVYRQVLRSLVYVNNHSEPTLGERRIGIIPMDSVPDCNPLRITISVLPLNDNAPELTLTIRNTIRYEENTGLLAFAADSGLIVSDMDHDVVIESATVVLNGALDGVEEMLGYNATLLPSTVNVTGGIDGMWFCMKIFYQSSSCSYIIYLSVGDSLEVGFRGQASIMDYESLLQSLTYINIVDEPTPGNRSISISISDGLQQDATIVIIIVISVNDNKPILQVSTPRVVYTEGDNISPVGVQTGLTVIDDDRNAVIENVTITLSGILEPDNEFLFVDGGSAFGMEIISGPVISLSQTSLLENYQVSQIGLNGKHIN